MTSNAFTGAGPGLMKRTITNYGDIVADGVAASPGPYSAMPPLMGTWLLQMAAFKPGP
jgi:hypothetical protein